MGEGQVAELVSTSDTNADVMKVDDMMYVDVKGISGDNNLDKWMKTKEYLP